MVGKMFFSKVKELLSERKFVNGLKLGLLLGVFSVLFVYFYEPRIRFGDINEFQNLDTTRWLKAAIFFAIFGIKCGFSTAFLSGYVFEDIIFTTGFSIGLSLVSAIIFIPLTNLLCPIFVLGVMIACRPSARFGIWLRNWQPF